MTLDSVQRALAEIRAGRMIILVDDEDRENEGDLCMAAGCATPEAINFMATHGRGLICLTLTEQRLQELQIPMMVADNTSVYGTAFTVSIEARRGVSTGISAADRAVTIRTALDPNAHPTDLVRPGHVFPLRARHGGVLVRPGQTEGSVDLARMAGLAPAGVICEIMNDDGTMARMSDLERFAEKHDLVIVSIAELIAYRLATETLVRRLTQRDIAHPELGKLTLYAYGTGLDSRQHLAVVKGDLSTGAAPLMRMHSGYPFSHVCDDLFGDGRFITHGALQYFEREGRGVLVCIDRGEPDVSLQERIDTWGVDPGEASPASKLSELGLGAQILRDLGLTRVRVQAPQPRYIQALERFGVRVEDNNKTDKAGVVMPKLEVV